MKGKDVKRAVCSLAGEFYSFLCGRYRNVGKMETERVFDEWGDVLSQQKQEQNLILEPGTSGRPDRDKALLPDNEESMDDYLEMWEER